MATMNISSAWCETPTLRGQRVVLAPLERWRAAELAELSRASGLHKAWYANGPAPGSTGRYIDKALAARAAGKAFPFVALDQDGDAGGSTRVYDPDERGPALKIE